MHLEKIVNNYINDQWVNRRRVLSFPQAREELLCGATMHFYEKGTSNYKSAFLDPESTTYHCNPVIASCDGVFPEIHFEKDTISTYGIKINDRSGNNISYVNCDNDFKI